MLNNMFYNVLYQVASLLIPIILTPYVSRVLGAEGIGLYTMADSYVQYFVMFGCLGLTTYGVREIAYVRNNREQLKNTFWELVILRSFTLGLSIVFYFVIFFVFDVKHSIIYKIVIITLISNIFDISWFYIGIEDFKNRAIKSTAIKVVTLILTLCLVKNQSHVWLYALITCIGNFMSQIIMWKGIVKKYSKGVVLSTQNIKRHLKISLTMFATAIVMQLYTLLDKVMLGEIVGNIPVGYYENAQKIIRSIATFVTAAMQAVTPTMANYYIHGKTKEFKESIYFTFKLVCFLAIPLTFGLIGVSGTFSVWFFGNEFKGIENLLILGAPIITSWGFTSILGYNILVATDRQNLLTLSVSAGAVVDIILNIFLIKKYQAYATMFSTLVAELVGFAFMLFFVRNTIEIKKLFRGNLRYLILSSFMCGLIISLQNILAVSIITTILQIIVGSLFYITILWLLKDELLLDFIKKGKNVFQGGKHE